MINLKNYKKGITLIGTLLAIGISMVIIGSILTMYKMAEGKSNVYQAKRDLGTMIHNLHSSSLSFQNGYQNMSNKKAINLGIVPKHKIISKKNNTISNRLAKGSVQGQIKFGSLNNGKYFTVSYTHLTASNCTKFASAIKPWADALQVSASPIVMNILNNYHYMYHNKGSMQKHILMNNDVNYNFKNKNLAYYPSNQHNTGKNRYKPKSLVYHPSHNRQGLFSLIGINSQYNVRSWKVTKNPNSHTTYYKDKYGNKYKVVHSLGDILYQKYNPTSTNRTNYSTFSVYYPQKGTYRNSRNHIHQSKIGKGGGTNKYGLTWPNNLNNPLPSNWTITGHRKNLTTQITKQHPTGVKAATPSNSSQKDLSNTFKKEWIFATSPKGKKYVFVTNQTAYYHPSRPTTYVSSTTFGPLNKNPSKKTNKYKYPIGAWSNGKCISGYNCSFKNLTGSSSSSSSSTSPTTTTSPTSSSSSTSSTTTTSPISSSSSTSSSSPTSSTSPTTTTSPTSSSSSSSSSPTITTSSSSSPLARSSSGSSPTTSNSPKTYSFSNLSSMNTSQIAKACSPGNRTLKFIDH